MTNNSISHIPPPQIEKNVDSKDKLLLNSKAKRTVTVNSVTPKRTMEVPVYVNM